MSQLIEDLLAFSKIARTDFVKQWVPMTNLAHLVEEDLRQGGHFLPTVIPDLPEAYGDAALLRQVWTNLLSNAYKFTRLAPSPHIEIGAQDGARETIYSIRDNGVGFDMRYADKLFGVFQRLHSADEFEGTGVGLAIVPRILHKHGGRVWAEATPGQGATFSFALPKPVGPPL